ncbi:hypothetical protein MKZ38_003923 [Zalerion maritima]|uniref:Uncharacterized protein n=1 Tax=Zalerion maritima TaxID=339359 RepID=A0AAD5RNJ1_9PEZI|nr:hypothetical protein MKZ38_003923 [Zalerion maritima]
MSGDTSRVLGGLSLQGLGHSTHPPTKRSGVELVTNPAWFSDDEDSSGDEDGATKGGSSGATAMASGGGMELSIIGDPAPRIDSNSLNRSKVQNNTLD